MIEVTQLKKHFGEVKAVDGVSFKAKNGAITGLLGPNGAGKTTVIRMLGTLVNIGSGTARIDDIDVSKDPHAARKCTGFLTDSQGLYKRMTTLENILYYAKLRKLDFSQAMDTIDRFSKWLDMGELLDRRTEGFSQGERMKVAIVRALVHEPSNVILDEPTNGLDVMSARALRDFIRRLKDNGHTVMLSSHVMQEVANLCDDIIIIAHGKVAAQGTTEQLIKMSGKDNLEDAFVALSNVSSLSPI